MTDPADLAAERGHTETGFFSSSDNDLSLAFASGADLDGSFDATCLDTGERLTVNGWLYVAELDAADEGGGEPTEADEWCDFDPDC